MELKRVVVTGIGCVTPIGNNVPDFWNALINGVSGAENITLFDASKFKTRFACEVKNFGFQATPAKSPGLCAWDPSCRSQDQIATSQRSGDAYGQFSLMTSKEEEPAPLSDLSPATPLASASPA